MRSQQTPEKVDGKVLERADPATKEEDVSNDTNLPAPDGEQADDIENPYIGFDDVVDESLSLSERSEAYTAFEARCKAHRSRWIAHGRPACRKCGGQHPEPCLSDEQLEQLNAARTVGRNLRRSIAGSSSEGKRALKRKGELTDDEYEGATKSTAELGMNDREPWLQELSSLLAHNPVSLMRLDELIVQMNNRKLDSRGTLPDRLTDEEILRFRNLIDVIDNDPVSMGVVAKLLSYKGKAKSEEQKPAASSERMRERKRRRVSKPSCDPAPKPVKKPDDNDRDGNNQGRPDLGGSTLTIR